MASDKAKGFIYGYITCAIVIILLLLLILPKYNPCNHPTIDLPEEYKEITLQDNLRGYFDQDSILHIEFNNPTAFKYEIIPEYTIELVNQHTARIQTEKGIFIVKPDKIQEFIELDNL